MESKLESMRSEFEAYLKTALNGEGEPQRLIFDAMNYSLLSGGKRIRALLVLLFAAVGGKDWRPALPLAAAIEMVHAYSLIHDDLPCMDDDDLRRGKPTNHKVFGYANAVLAGDGLLTAAFETALGDECLRNIGFERAAKAAKILADCAGAMGMVGGQVLDLAAEGMTDLTQEQLVDIHSRKTGALIKAACLMGCVAADANDEVMDCAASFAENIGMAFQIRDDLLDAEGSTEILGKNAGSDAEAGKCTFYTLYGGDKCRALIEEYTSRAKVSVKQLPGSDVLQNLADYLAGREN